MTAADRIDADRLNRLLGLLEEACEAQRDVDRCRRQPPWARRSRERREALRRRRKALEAADALLRQHRLETGGLEVRT